MNQPGRKVRAKHRKRGVFCEGWIEAKNEDGSYIVKFVDRIARRYPYFGHFVWCMYLFTYNGRYVQCALQLYWSYSSVRHITGAPKYSGAVSCAVPVAGPHGRACKHPKMLLEVAMLSLCLLFQNTELHREEWFGQGRPEESVWSERGGREVEVHR